MRKIVVLFMISIMTYPFIQAQTSHDTITEAGTSFLYKGFPLSASQLLDKMQNNPGAYSEMSIAKLNYDVATVFIYAASFCVGFPIGQKLAGGKPAWGLLGVAAGAVVVAVPFGIVANLHAQKAVRIYNSNLTRFGLNKVNMKIEFSGSGIGLCCRF